MHLRYWADRTLVEAFLITRDETLFRLLYKRHKDTLWRLALRLTGGNHLDSEEIVQDSWLRAVEKLSQFRWESSLRTWLSGFVVMRTKEHWRNQLSENQKFEPLESAIFQTIEPHFSPEKLDLENAFADLPPGFRAVLTLHDLEGFRHEEIAEMLGIAIGTSKSQLSRARAAVRKLLD
ncbi:MAG: RNA polymerase sigma factor [Saprospiraceae bacterium]